MFIKDTIPNRTSVLVASTILGAVVGARTSSDKKAGAIIGAVGGIIVSLAASGILIKSEPKKLSA
jgi:hypothetical protein